MRPPERALHQTDVRERRDLEVVGPAGRQLNRPFARQVGPQDLLELAGRQIEHDRRTGDAGLARLGGQGGRPSTSDRALRARAML